jgi:hypothetical protein
MYQTEEFKNKNSTKISHTKKKVRFFSIVQVVLIPCIEEYKMADIAKNIWMSKEDYYINS